MKRPTLLPYSISISPRESQKLSFMTRLVQKGALPEENVTRAGEKECVWLRELEKESVPILRLAAPKTMREVYRSHNKIPHAAYRELGCREPSCHPNRSITIRAKDWNVLILICFQHRFRGMPIRIGRTNRDDRILWLKLPKPGRIQRATRSVMGHFQ